MIHFNTIHFLAPQAKKNMINFNTINFSRAVYFSKNWAERSEFWEKWTEPSVKIAKIVKIWRNIINFNIINFFGAAGEKNMINFNTINFVLGGGKINTINFNTINKILDLKKMYCIFFFGLVDQPWLWDSLVAN